MQKLVIAVCFTIATLAPGLAGAQATPKPPAAQAHQLTPQQQKMKDCNAQAKEKQLKGKDRKTFMSSCLKGKSGM
jgi:hypothetical protein